MPIHDPDLGKKIDHLKLRRGNVIEASKFQTRRIALALGIAEATFSRKKSGAAVVTERDWSNLTAHFELQKLGCQPEDWGRSLEDFKAMVPQLDDAAPAATSDAALQTLFSLATRISNGPRPEDASRRKAGKCRIIRIDPRAPVVRVGGIGTEPIQAGEPVFRSGDKARIRVTVPDDGYLVVLNHRIRGEVTCLMPTYFAPDLKVEGGDVTLPNTPDFPNFPVGGLPDTYRIFAIWFAERPTASLARRAGQDVSPWDLDPHQVLELAGAVRQAEKTGGGVMVTYADYRVIA